MRRSALRKAVAATLFCLALLAGFVTTSQLGNRWARAEAESQLGRLLEANVRIETLRLRFRYGIQLHWDGIRVEYPPEEGNPVFAERAMAALDVPSLLVGRFRIARLEVEGLRVDLRRDPAGVFHPPWFRSRAEVQQLHEDNIGFEDRLRSPQGVIAAVHLLLRDQQVAEHIELRRAALTFRDESPRAGSTAQTTLQLEAIDARLDRSWLRGESDFELAATWIGNEGRRAPIEMAGRWRDDDSDLHLAMAFTGIELASLRPYLVGTGSEAEIAGRVSGVVAIVTPETNRGLIEIDWSFNDLESEIAIGETRLRLSAPIETLQAQLSIEPRRLRLESARLQGQSLELRVRGSAARPLGPDSLVTVRSDLARTELSDLRRMIQWLPPTEAEPFLLLLDRMQSGYIPRVGMRGGARLKEWRELLRGDRLELPDTLRLFADIEDVTFGTSPTDTMSDMSGRVTFSGEMFEVHGLRAIYNDEPLPQVDLAVLGISTLLGGDAEDQQLTRRARPLPGLGTLWDIVRGDPETRRETPPSPIRVTLDDLQHPALRWPLRNAEIQIDPSERDLHITIRHAEWNGRPIRGEAILDRGPEPELRIELILSQAQPPEPHSAEPHEPRTAEAVVAVREPAVLGEEPERDAPWAKGRFTSAGIHTGPLVFDRVQAEFAVRGQTLALSDIQATLEGGGRLDGSASFALDREGKVPVGVDFNATGAESNRVAQLFGLNPGVASGRADVRGQLAGPVRPGARLIDELVGRVVIDSRDGELKQKVPLLAAVAHAIEGWSPTAASKTLQYERIETRIDLNRGLISTDRFALEGPLRIVASGSVDLRTEPAPIKATIGVFLLRQADRLLGGIPLVKLLVPGSDRGLLGAYFDVSGPVAQPVIRPMPMKSIAEGVPLPEVLRQPFEALQKLFSGSNGDRNGRGGGGE